MKKIIPLLVDDIRSTNDIASNSRLDKTSYPHLLNNISEILDSYQLYENENGNALRINPIAITSDLKTGLHKNYTSPPKCLSYIQKIRKSSPSVCPMCGSPKTSSVDHVLPKEIYPEFSIYSKNLVPACDCNSKRKTSTSNPASGGRVLHPYFDNCMLDRQITCLISPNSSFPHVEIRIDYINPTDPMFAALQFHVEKVVLPSGLIQWLESQWSTLAEYPAGIIHTLPHQHINSTAEILVYLQDALSRHDRSYGTPNNWESIFAHGLLQSANVHSWLMTTHNNCYPQIT